jgi:8-oxo-dGTP diphosphatase
MRAVAAAVIIENGRLFLARRPEGDHLAGMWELPGGKVEPGESLQECLARELQEELEMDCVVGEVLASTRYEYAHGAFEVSALRVQRRSGFQLHTHSEFKWVTRDELAATFMAPADQQLTGTLLALTDW